MLGRNTGAKKQIFEHLKASALSYAPAPETCRCVEPAEATPPTAPRAAELARRAGIPDGVLNIVVGDPAPIGAVYCLRAVV